MRKKEAEESGREMNARSDKGKNENWHLLHNLSQDNDEPRNSFEIQLLCICV